MVSVGAVGGNTMGAALEPRSDVGSHVWPKETASDAVQGLVSAEVSSSGVPVKDGEDVLA